MGGATRVHQNTVIAFQLILTGYGHWLPNDPRGSGSAMFREQGLRQLGEIHHGRRKDQPSKPDVRAFYKEAEGLLKHSTVWFRKSHREAIAEAFARQTQYTIWACAVCSNHAHLCVRVHRDRGDAIWARFAEASKVALLDAGLVPNGHPVWAARPYTQFLYTPERIRGAIRYIESNPMKEGLAPQHWSFVVPYDGWPRSEKR